MNNFEKIYNFSPIFFLKNNNTQQNIYYSSFYILFCFYSNLSSSSTGGAISISTSNDFSFLLEYSIFSYCSSISYGGGIYISSDSKGESFISKCCSFFCYNNGGQDISGQFSFIRTNFFKNNIFEYISNYKCSPKIDIKLRWSTFLLFGGIQRIQNLNSSYHEINAQSSLFVKGGNSVEITFSNFICTISGHQCITIGGSSNSTFKYNNIIDNKSLFDYGVLMVFENIYLIVSNSIFLNNSSPISLFHIFTNQLFVHNCWIQSLSTLSSGILTISNCEITDLTTLTLKIVHFASFYCNANIPYIELSLKKTNQIRFCLLFNFYF